MKWTSLVLSATVLSLATSSAMADDWPQFLGPNRDGNWNETGILETFPEGKAKIVWRAPIGMGYAGPAVVGDRVFITDRTLGQNAANPSNPFDRETEVPGQERVVCLDRKSGEQLWAHAYPSTYRISYAAGPRCTPTVDGDLVYTLGAMGDLLCLEADSGKVVWQKNFMKDYDATLPVWGFSSSPLIDGDNLICLAGGSDGKLVIAFDKKTGKENWSALSFESGDFGYAPPVIYDIEGQRTLVIWHPRAVVGLDPSNGKKLWEVPFEARAALTAPMPRQCGNKIFVTSFYNGSMLIEVNGSDAKPVWKSKARGERPNQTVDLSSIMPTPFVIDEHVYGICSYGQLRCLELASGKRIWDTMDAVRGPLTPERVASRETPSETQPWVERWANAFLTKNNGQFILFNEQGELVIAKLTPDGYKETGRAQVVKPTNRMAGRPVVWTMPAFANKQAFVRNDEEIVCVSLAKE